MTRFGILTQQDKIQYVSQIMDEIGKQKYLGIAFLLEGLISIFETYVKWRLGLYGGGDGRGLGLLLG